MTPVYWYWMVCVLRPSIVCPEVVAIVTVLDELSMRLTAHGWVIPEADGKVTVTFPEDALTKTKHALAVSARLDVTIVYD